ncbi:MAG: hypothetical protein BWK76_01080 [Desulfobulbaceae bacterium A2]|nr:MAG: hypothetical protein BWK76_01080 [Desulfobulbaceae bacterium A2]
MNCPRSIALRLALESFAASQGLDDIPLPALRLHFDGATMRAELGEYEIKGCLSGHVLFTAQIMGTLLRAPNDAPHLAWLPVINRNGARIHAGRINFNEDIHVHECRLAEAMLEAGRAWQSVGEEEEACLCFRRALGGSPQYPHRVELLPPSDLSSENMADFLTRSLAFEEKLHGCVPAAYREMAGRVKAGADDALAHRRKSLPAAIKAIAAGASAPDPVERAAFAEKLIDILAEINLGRSDPTAVCSPAGALLWPLLNDQPFVQEVAYIAAVILAERLHSGQRYREALPWLDRLIEVGLLRREHLAMRFEVYCALGNAKRAQADWDRVAALRDLRPQYGMLLENRERCTNPAWSEFCQEAEARAVSFRAANPASIPVHTMALC